MLGYSASLLGDGATAVFFADLTDALAEEQRAAEAQRFAEVGRIASAMAHELKSPLATVELYANLMRRALAEDATSLERLDVIKDQTRLCLDRIGAIMHSINPDLAKAGGMTLTPVVPLLRDVVDDLRRRHEDARIQLRGASGEPRVALAENDLRSVVSNLIVNAVQATGSQAAVTVTLSSDDDALTITVADRGPGLPEGNVFEAFYTTKSSGTGLGLWLTRRLIEDAGGSISSGNRRGGGAVFTVRLPLPRHERLRGARILVVEDDAPLREVAVAALEECGAHVTAAAAGNDVPLDSERWDCAALDFHLPGNDRHRHRDAPGARDPGAPREQRPGRRSGLGRGARQARVVPAQTRRDRALPRSRLTPVGGDMSVSDKGRVIIADDHGLFRQGLRQLLETEGYVVAAEATSGDEALTAVAEHQGCVLLLDIAMPGMNGLEVARRLNERGDDVKVVMLSAREDRDALFSAISAGARGYVAKDAEPDQLFAAIDLVMRGGTVLSTGVAQNLGEGIRQLDYAPGAYEQRRLALTDRELEILRLLATPKSPAQMASQLFLSKKTVQNHISAIYRKLDVRSRSEAIVKGMELHLIDNKG